MDIFQMMQDNSNLIIGTAILLLLAYGFYSYSTDKYTIFDRMTNPESKSGSGSGTGTGSGTGSGSGSGTASKSRDPTDAISSPDPMQSSALNPLDLLPKYEKNKWTTLNPITQNSLTVPDVMQSDFFIGINTTGTSKKNPNLQGIGREDPVIAKLDTSGQFNISSMDHR